MTCFASKMKVQSSVVCESNEEKSKMKTRTLTCKLKAYFMLYFSPCINYWLILCYIFPLVLTTSIRQIPCTPCNFCISCILYISCIPCFPCIFHVLSVFHLLPVFPIYFLHFFIPCIPFIC